MQDDGVCQPPLPTIEEADTVCRPKVKSNVRLVRKQELCSKRRKPCSPDFRSPLDRSRSRSPIETRRFKHPRREPLDRRADDNTDGLRRPRIREDTPRYLHRHRHYIRKHGHRSRGRQPSGISKVKPMACVLPRQQGGGRYDLERSLSKMRIPDNMRRTRTGSLHSPNIVPRNTQFYVEKPVIWNMAPEPINNPFLISLLEKTPLITEVSTKMVRLAKLQENFEAIRRFMRTSSNVHAWKCMRQETMAGAGLIGLTAFLEETISWQKLYLEHGLPLVGEDGDVIFSTASFLCQQILYKARDICGCHCQRHEVQSLIRQLTYLVVFSGRLLQAAELLQEIYIEDRLLYICAMAIVAALAPQIPSSNPLSYMIMDYICNFQFGTMMSLLSVVINEHSLRCNNLDCAITSRSVLGSHAATRGLFFIPSAK